MFKEGMLALVGQGFIETHLYDSHLYSSGVYHRLAVGLGSGCDR